MEQSNISRDHIALEAMKIIMQATTHEIINPVQRFKRWLGMTHKSWLGGMSSPENIANIARKAYDIADAMVAKREKKNGGVS